MMSETPKKMRVSRAAEIQRFREISHLITTIKPW
jgi:hypothetical protein